ncbi:MAG: hypothetical protein JOY71_20970, partial [Acetobacteraceae bacterium]|nr:hypothetical protein [Acetobacteraceae bacterium]
MFAALCPCAWALDPALDVSQYAHTAWTIRDGFFDSPIQTIAQTPDGYLWLGTEFGLLRFDGLRKASWNPPGGEHLPSANITKLLVTRDGRLWIGTRAGLASWKNGRYLRYAELAEQTVAALAEDHEGSLWVGTWGRGGGLCAIRGGTTRCYGQDVRLGLGVLSLFEENGSLWAGAGTGLWRWKPDPPKRYADPEPTRDFAALSQSDDGRLLIGRPTGLKELAGEMIEPSPIGANARSAVVRTLLRDRSGGLWIGTADRGLLHVHQGRTDQFDRSDGLSGASVPALFEDREGSIWTATDEGLDRFRDLAIPTMTSKQGLPSDPVGAVLAARDGSVWISAVGGLSRWKNGQITVYRQRDGLPDKAPPGLMEDSRGRIWVSTRVGFAYWEDGRFVPLRSGTARPFELIAEDPDGSLWVTEGPGLLHLRSNEVVERIALRALGYSDTVSFLTGDAKRGGLWLGFSHGGIAFFKDGQIREKYGTAEGLGAGMVTGVYPHPDGSIWVASQDGLGRIRDGHVATLNSRNGLPCDFIRAAIEDDDHAVWLYLACGLVRISRNEFEAWTADPKHAVTNTFFDASDGAVKQPSVGYVPRAAKLKNGQLWFSTLRGVSIVDPRHLAEDKIPPPVHIEEVVADDKTLWQNLTSVSPANPRLPALTHRLEIRYTALSLGAPEKIRFKYTLEGYDRNWMEVVNKRDVEYTNLPPRNYRFRVMASNNSGVWNETGDTLEFSVAPAYYQTNWFRALCAAAVLLAMWALYRYRVWQVQRES